ncbi:nucleoside 2-deoxyribosyltransferase [Alkalibacterium iburiense]|uniref:Nucleoside 2-deoxyribosyltransferase n=1 Tax=Alkalibacterium iburiense TaxID=290589 RepID=A0ABN0XR85_9LACT
MKKFYVASSFKNKQAVRSVSKRLKDKGFIQTYDWTENSRASEIEELKRIGILEKGAVMDADFLIVLLPAGKGSHIELGIALGLEKPVYLYSPNDEVNHPDTTSTFYHLDNVHPYIGSLNAFIQTVLSKEQNK